MLFVYRYLSPPGGGSSVVSEEDIERRKEAVQKASVPPTLPALAPVGDADASATISAVASPALCTRPVRPTPHAAVGVAGPPNGTGGTGRQYTGSTATSTVVGASHGHVQLATVYSPEATAATDHASGAAAAGDVAPGRAPAATAGGAAAGGGGGMASGGSPVAPAAAPAAAPAGPDRVVTMRAPGCGGGSGGSGGGGMSGLGFTQLSMAFRHIYYFVPRPQVGFGCSRGLGFRV